MTTSIPSNFIAKPTIVPPSPPKSHPLLFPFSNIKTISNNRSPSSINTHRSSPSSSSPSVSGCFSLPCLFLCVTGHRSSWLRTRECSFLCFRSNDLRFSLTFLKHMDGVGGTSLFPQHRTKTLHLVRHAQGIHNVEGEKNHDAYMSEDLFDAHLTPLGWQQVDNLRKHVNSCGIIKKIDLVIASPLLRTMQTAVGVFGGEHYVSGKGTTPLMAENVGNSNRSAISSSDRPPFIAVELCREHLGVHPCDRRRSITEYRPLFPAIDFSLLENDEDILWKPDIRELDEEVAARGIRFINWLWTRKEKEIAIVSHSGFLFHTLEAFGKDLHPVMREEICTHFANCELRSVVIVDRSLAGSDVPTTNYPGKIPLGMDLPSEVAHEMHPENGFSNSSA